MITSVADSPEILEVLDSAYTALVHLMQERDLWEKPSLTLEDMDALSHILTQRIRETHFRFNPSGYFFRLSSAVRGDDWPLGEWQITVTALRNGAKVGELLRSRDVAA